ncbi:MAG: YIP1 family protein [Pyrinomonadaceae bacterium]
MSDPNLQFQAPPPPPIGNESERPRPTNLMWAGVTLIVIGIIIVILGIPGIALIVGGIGTGAAVCCLGILFFAFSFMRLPAVKDPPPKISTAATLTGIFFEPTSVFRNLRAHPQWMAAILIAGILNGAYVAAFVHRLTPERIINFTVDKLEESPFKPPPEALARMRTEGAEAQKAPTQQAGNIIKSVVGHFFGVAFIAGLCLLGVMAFGGRMHYWQTFSVVAYVALPVTIIQKVISFIILYLKSPDDIHPLLGQDNLVYDNLGLLVSSKDHPVLFVLATSIGLLGLYRLWLTGTGLREGGYKVSSSAAWGVTITLFVLFLLFGVALAAIFPSFLG